MSSFFWVRFFLTALVLLTFGGENGNLNGFIPIFFHLPGRIDFMGANRMTPAFSFARLVSMGRGAVFAILATVAISIPAVMALFSLVGFPVMVILDRDLQLNGKTVPATVVAYKLTFGKQNLKIHNYKVRYLAGSARRQVWVYWKDDRLRPGDRLDLVYSPLFTRYAMPAQRTPDPWNRSLVPRILARLFIGGVCSAMAVGFVRRFSRQARQAPQKNQAPGPSEKKPG